MESRLDSVLQTLYTAALDAAAWPAALTELADTMGGVDTTVEVHTGPGTVPLFFSCGHRLPDDGVDAYLTHYSKVCPRIAMIDAQRAGSVGVDYDFTSEADMDRDEFYSDFLAPHGLRYFMSACLANQPGSVVSFAAVHRSPRQGHASVREVERLTKLIPHLKQALDIYLRFQGQVQREGALLDSFEQLSEGVILLDDAGFVIHINGKAESILRTGDGLSLGGNGLLIAEPCARQAFQTIVAGFLDRSMAADLQPGGDVLVPRLSGSPPYILRVRRLPPRSVYDVVGLVPAAIVFLSDPMREAAIEAARVAAAFGLTQSEAELAAALYAGCSLREHAEARGIRISTARFHLYQAMEKMGVRRQTDMIRLLSRLSHPSS